MYVICKECGERHKASDVEVLNVEEDEMGRDLLWFVCPTTEKETESLVFRG